MYVISHYVDRIRDPDTSLITHYRVRWQGYPPEEDTLEPVGKLVAQGCRADLDRFDAERDQQEAARDAAHAYYDKWLADPVKQKLPLCHGKCKHGRTVKEMAKNCGRKRLRGGGSRVCWEKVPPMARCGNPDCQDPAAWFHEGCYYPFPVPCCQADECRAVCFEQYRAATPDDQLRAWVAIHGAKFGARMRGRVARLGATVGFTNCGTLLLCMCVCVCAAVWY